jgi:hypothetical protein
MKKIFLSLLVFFSLFYFAYAQNFGARKENLGISLPEKALNLGETLQYSVEWLGIPVGLVTLKIIGIEKINNFDCYHINAKAMPNDFLKRIIDLEYEVNSYLDTRLHVSRRFEKIRSLNGKRKKTLIDFDPQNNLADFKTEGSAGSYNISAARKRLNKIIPPTNKIPKNTQDLLSSLYYFRFLNLEKGHSYSVNIYYERKNWDFSFIVKEPFLKDIRKKGTFVIFEISPNSQLNDFILGKRKFSVFFTADSCRIPFAFSFATGIGSIQARIQKITK